MTLKTLNNYIGAHLKEVIFLLSSFATIVFAHITHITHEWLAILVLILMVGIFIRREVKYLMSIFAGLVLVFIYRGNITAYNYYFEILVLVVSSSLAFEFIETLLSNCFHIKIEK